MGKKRFVDRSKYGWKPLHHLNGVPWPRIGNSGEQPTEVPLKEEYLLRSMDYLDTPQAKKIFETQARIIQKNGCKGIIDVGCRTGTINDILQDWGYHSYRYMGFDTSPEPIQFSNEVWADFENIDYRLASWDETEKLRVDFEVDCVIWSGVLLYRPMDHFELFKKITLDLYCAKYAIIQEPMREQEHWIPGLKLNTIADDLDVYREFGKSYNETIVEANIFSGRRKVLEIEL